MNQGKSTVYVRTANYQDDTGLLFTVNHIVSLDKHAQCPTSSFNCSISMIYTADWLSNVHATCME